MENNNKILKYILSVFFTITFVILGAKSWDGLTASSGDNLDSQKWNQLVSTIQSGIPSGAVSAFDGQTCPSGWTKFSDADRRVIIGISNTTSPVDASTGKPALSAHSFRSLGGNEYPPIDTNVLSFDFKIHKGAGGSNIPKSTYPYLGGSNMIMYYTSLSSPISTTTVVLTNTQRDWAATDNMQPYIALTYCRKN